MPSIKSCVSVDVRVWEKRDEVPCVCACVWEMERLSLPARMTACQVFLFHHLPPPPLNPTDREWKRILHPKQAQIPFRLNPLQLGEDVFPKKDKRDERGK